MYYSEDGRTRNADNAICPACGYIFNSCWEWSDSGEHECDCGATFFYERDISVDFTAKLIKK